VVLGKIAHAAPVILASDGQILDGMHRIAKAVLIGHTAFQAQRLPVDPERDWTRTQSRPAFRQASSLCGSSVRASLP
jgi:hypothetical protein